MSKCDQHNHDHGCCHSSTPRAKAITREQKIEELKRYKKALKLELEWVEDKIKELKELRDK